MPSHKRSWSHQALRRIRLHFEAGHFGRHYHSRRVVAIPSVPLRRSNRVWSSGEHFLLWIRGRQRQHFGPKSRVPDLFQRRDHAYFSLEAKDLRWYAPPPREHHDLLDAAAKVGVVEERIGYCFKDKMTCIEALKISGEFSPLYFKGVIHGMDRNNRLALLGDRILSLALCEIWFSTGRSPVEYNQMRIDVETRSALYKKGRSLDLHKSIIISNGSPAPTPDNIAETFEAILGAIYVDSGHEVRAVKDVIRKLGLDKHKLLKVGKDTVRETTFRKDLHMLDAKHPSAGQCDDKLSIQNNTTAETNVRRIDSKSHSFSSGSLRKLVNLLTGFFSLDIQSIGQKDAASSPNLSVREGVESTQPSAPLNDTKPVSNESRGNVTLPSITTSQSLSESQADMKIEPKVSTKPESEEAITMTAKIPAAPPQQVVTAGSEKSTVVGKKAADPLPAPSSRRDKEREIWAKATQEAVVKAKETVTRMRNNGTKVNYDDIFPRIWKKMQLRIVQEISGNRIRMIREDKRRIALETQNKIKEAAANQKAVEAAAWQKAVKAAAKQKALDAIAKQKAAEAAAQQKTANEALMIQKKKVNEPSTTPKKEEVTATGQKKANESSAPLKSSSEPSTIQTKLVEASAVERKESKVSTAPKKVKEAPTTQKPDKTLITKKKLDNGLTSETSDTQKMVEEASSRQKKIGEVYTEQKVVVICEPSRDAKAALGEPAAEKSSADLGYDSFERETTILSATVEQLRDAVNKVVGSTTKQPQSESSGPSVLNPASESNEMGQKLEIELEGDATNIAEEDYKPAQEVSDASKKSRLQKELEKPAPQVDTEPVVFESEIQMLMAHLAENDDSRSNEPVEMDHSPKQERSDIKLPLYLNADIEKSTSDSVEEDPGEQNSKEVKVEPKPRRKAIAISEEYAILARKLADRL